MTPQPLYHLYHRDALWFPYGGAIAKPLDPEVLGWPARYRHVADLQVGSLGAAYALSQHLERAWWLNPSVILFEESRSTSVGDVLLDAAGAAWAVAPLGFVRLAAGGHPAGRHPAGEHPAGGHLAGEDPDGSDAGSKPPGQTNGPQRSNRSNPPTGGRDVSP